MPTVRWFGGAAEAAGTESEHVAAGTTLGELLDHCVSERPALATVLPRCSLLLDGVRVDDRSLVLSQGSVLDVLPPFAGG